MLMRTKLSLHLFCMFLLGYMLTLTVYGDTTSINVSGESAILMDAKTGRILYSKNIDTPQYPASITKLMTALLSLESQEPNNIITMSKEAVFSIERGSSHIGLDVDEQITFDQALHALLLNSANEVANGIAELCDGSINAFADHMTRRAKELGATNTSFKNPHGLHDKDHYTTAYDMALITRELLKNPYFLEIMATPTYQIPATNKTSEIRYMSQQHHLMNKQRNLTLYREDVIAGKTGYTDQARQTLVTVAKRDDLELICVILKSEKSTLYSDTTTLLDYGFDNFRSISFYNKDDIISELPMYKVESGELVRIADCDIAVSQDVNVLVDNAMTEQKINPIISLPTKIEKNASVGDVIGTITYMYDTTPLGTYDLSISSLKNIETEAISDVVLNEDTNSNTSNVSTTANPFLRIYPYIVAFVTLLMVIFFISFVLKRHKQKQFKKKRTKVLDFAKTVK